jgi:hypothetical protein
MPHSPMMSAHSGTMTSSRRQTASRRDQIVSNIFVFIPTGYGLRSILWSKRNSHRQIPIPNEALLALIMLIDLAAPRRWSRPAQVRGLQKDAAVMARPERGLSRRALGPRGPGRYRTGGCGRRFRMGDLSWCEFPKLVDHTEHRTRVRDGA